MAASAELGDELRRLQAENLRLIELLEAHGIEWREQAPRSSVSVAPPRSPVRLSAQERVELFARLFRGRTDVFPVRWESRRLSRGCFQPRAQGRLKDAVPPRQPAFHCRVLQSITWRRDAGAPCTSRRP